MAKDKADRLPHFRLDRCIARQDGGHEPLLNGSFMDESRPVEPMGAGGSHFNMFEGGRLVFRVCKYCGLVYAMPLPWGEE